MHPAPEPQLRVATKQPKLPHLRVDLEVQLVGQILAHADVTQDLVPGEALANFGVRGRQQLLIRIEPEDPLATGLVDSGVAGGGEIVAPFKMTHADAEFPAI